MGVIRGLLHVVLSIRFRVNQIIMSSPGLAMIFGNWNAGGAFLGSLLFGFFDSWQEKLAILQMGIPNDAQRPERPRLVVAA